MVSIVNRISPGALGAADVVVGELRDRVADDVIDSSTHFPSLQVEHPHIHHSCRYGYRHGIESVPMYLKDAMSLRFQSNLGSLNSTPKVLYVNTRHQTI